MKNNSKYHIRIGKNKGEKVVISFICDIFFDIIKFDHQIPALNTHL